MKSYLNSINYFRGIAIVLIVAGHCYAIAGWQIDTFGERVIANLITGGTALFVFISGFLFHHIFAQKFSYRAFITRKVKDVLVPYLMLSIPYVVYVVFYRGYGYHSGYAEGNLEAVVFYLATGRMLFAYWYIPFIMLTFALSPLHARFVRSRHQGGIILLLLGVSMLLHRPVDDINVMQSVVYFAPVYLFGIWASINRDLVFRVFAGREALLMMAVVALALLQAALYGGYGNFHKPPFAYAGLDVLLLQKLVLCLFFMVLLQRLETRPVPVLALLAKSSFPIFFIHPFVIELILTWQARQPVWIPMGFPVAVLLVTLLSMVIAGLTRKLLPKHSRRIIGA